jgi:hypothetical protein
MRNLPRHYTVRFFGPGFLVNEEKREVSTTHRIRAIAVILFRKWYGCEPDFSWGADGDMAEARDKRGRIVWVDQHNHDLTQQWHTPDPRLWTLFCLHGGKFVPVLPPSRQITEVAA